MGVEEEQREQEVPRLCGAEHYIDDGKNGWITPTSAEPLLISKLQLI